MRSFLAFDVPEPVAIAIARAQGRLAVGRMVPRENLHVTLAFLDDQPDAVLDELSAALAEIALPRFAATPTGFAHFGKARPRLAYLGIAPEPPLLALHQAARKAARRVGITLSHERYVPHVTLARFSGHEGSRALGAVTALAGLPVAVPPFEVFGFGLYGSTLRPEGPRYELLESFPLRG